MESKSLLREHETDDDDDEYKGKFQKAIESLQEGIVTLLGFAGAIGLAVFTLVMAFGLPITMILVGANNIENCPVENDIPIFLIVAGFSGLVLTPLTLLVGVFINFLPDCMIDWCTWLNLSICTLLSMFSFVWFIAGNVWVFSHYQTVNYDESSDHYCNEVCYKFAFSAIIVTYIFITLSIGSLAYLARKFNELENK